MRERSPLWICPRRPKSGWSRINNQRITKLERAGPMTAAGRAAFRMAELRIFGRQGRR
jgi:hypothetical protein